MFDSGKMCYANGEVYDGNWRGDVRHGAGVYYFRNGSSFSGVWVAGEPEIPSEVLDKAKTEIPVMIPSVPRQVSVAKLPDVHLELDSGGGSVEQLFSDHVRTGDDDDDEDDDDDDDDDRDEKQTEPSKPVVTYTTNPTSPISQVK